MIEISQSGDDIVLLVSETDRVTVLNAGELKGELMLSLGRTKGTVYVDLSNIKFMDSTGISVLISGLKGARENGCGFTLRNVQPEVLRLLQLMKIDKIIDIEK